MQMLSDAFGICIRHDPCVARYQLMGRRCCRQRARPFLLNTLQGTYKFEKFTVNKTCKYIFMISNTGWCDGYMIYCIEINIHKGSDFSVTLPNAKPAPYNHHWNEPDYLLSYHHAQVQVERGLGERHTAKCVMFKNWGISPSSRWFVVI